MPAREWSRGEDTTKTIKTIGRERRKAEGGKNGAGEEGKQQYHSNLVNASKTRIENSA